MAISFKEATALVTIREGFEATKPQKKDHSSKVEKPKKSNPVLETTVPPIVSKGSGFTPVFRDAESFLNLMLDVAEIAATAANSDEGGQIKREGTVGKPKWRIAKADWIKFTENCWQWDVKDIQDADVDVYANNVTMVLMEAAKDAMPRTSDFRHKGTWWPGTIAERTAPKSYVVVLRDGRVWRRHIDQMRKGDNSLEDNVIVENSEGENTEVNKPMVNSPTDSTTVQLGVHKPDNYSQLKHHQQTSLPRRVRWEVVDNNCGDMNSAADRSSSNRSDVYPRMSTPNSREPDKHITTP
ncbi:hypothetical protein LOTGIDRAFT_153303 [Lottia gigantea]|uniref:Uncharacterized protein n=1 Tax=Lottia gigantea TaxID=225164 RepID=V4AFF3_LOTGI|nr:hypothetical protein LOTGIDRAFT_153303 [Lottia gigantea]ESO93830.1 hypothetical protein LOTGIDRAFT_153303 [Lottia gigantea]